MKQASRRPGVYRRVKLCVRITGFEQWRRLFCAGMAVAVVRLAVSCSSVSVCCGVEFTMEADDPAVVDDGGGHVAVAEHVAAPAGLEVAGVDDAPFFVAVGDDLEQELGTVVGAWTASPARR
jgi:hypothetical protein